MQGLWFINTLQPLQPFLTLQPLLILVLHQL